MRLLPLHRYIHVFSALCKNVIHRSAIYPFYASFKLTSRCHFACPFCNVKNDKTPDLTTQQIKAILDNLSKSSVLMTSFEGGEPLLRTDIAELLRYAREKCGFYLLFTTSVKNLCDYPLEEYSKYIDFLHISIDEGHNNLVLYEKLPEIIKRSASQVSVQVVVTSDTVSALEQKVKTCHDAGANIVIIPATHMDNTQNQFPDIDKMEIMLLQLRKKYPYTIHTPQGYFKALKNRQCSSASVIIAPDGHLYYPCHIQGTKGPDLSVTPLDKWLKTGDAKQFRKAMKSCGRNCGWYQYYSIASYTSMFTVLETVMPMLRKKK